MPHSNECPDTLNLDALFQLFSVDFTRKSSLGEYSEARVDLAYYARRNLSRLGSLAKESDFSPETHSIFFPGMYDVYPRLFLFLLRDAAQGNADALQVCRTIFRKIYRDDYNYVKRLHVLSFRALGEYTWSPEDDEDDEDYSDVDTCIRIICMAKILSVPFEPEDPWEGIIEDCFSRDEAKEQLAGFRAILEKRKKALENARNHFSYPLLEDYVMLMKLAEQVNMIYNNLEKSEDVNALKEVLVEDADVHLAARTYLDLWAAEWPATEEFLDSFAYLIEYIRQTYIDDLSNRMFMATALNLFGDSNPAPDIDISRQILQSVSAQNNKIDVEQINLLRRENAELKSRLNVEKGKNRSFHEQVDELRKQTDEHSYRAAELEKQTEDRDKELEALRRLLFKNDEELKPSISDEEMIAYLSSQKACVIGGHPNWLNKIRALLPGWKYIAAAGLQNKDAAFLAGLDCVFIFTDHLDHKTYNKVMQVVRPTGVPIGYITSVNLRLSLEQFYASFFPDD